MIVLIYCILRVFPTAQWVGVTLLRFMKKSRVLIAEAMCLRSTAEQDLKPGLTDPGAWAL